MLPLLVVFHFLCCDRMLETGNLLLALEVRKFKLGSPSAPYASTNAGKVGKWADAKADRLWNGEGHGYVKLMVEWGSTIIPSYCRAL